MADSGDKTHDPTPHRRQQARAEGRVARSQDLSSAGLLLGSLAALAVTGGALVNFLVGMLAGSLRGEAWLAWLGRSPAATNEALIGQWNELLSGLAKVLLPTFILLVLIAVGVNMLQTGFLLSPGKAAPDLSRINPLAGLRRMFSGAGAARLAFGLLKLTVIGAMAMASLYQRRDDLASLAGNDLARIVPFVWEVCLSTCVKIGFALLALAAVDYAFARWKHERDLKMTPQELREEMRNLQGDPQVAARRRSVQRQLALGRMSDAVPRADVVLLQPGHLAVAVRYDAATMHAPLVVARGARAIAERIAGLAREHKVPIVEKGDLARALYEQVELHSPIPAEHYAAVADLLAYAYQAKTKPVAGV